MKPFLLSLLVVAQIFALGCDQDPLKNEDPNVRSGIPLSEKPNDGGDLIGQDTLLFGFTQNLNFYEGKEAEYVLEARTVGFTDDIKIEFLNLPKGATYDEATRTLKWAPELDAVVGSDNFQSVRMRARMSVKNGAAVREKNFDAWVFRNEAQPVIESVEFNQQNVREGKSTTFIVKVRDPESFDSATLEGRQPKLQIVGSDNFWVKGAGLARINPSVNRDRNDPEVWTFTGNVFTNEDLVSSDELISVGFMAFSGFGNASPVKSADFRLKNRVSRPSVSWMKDQVWEVKAGIMNHLSVSIFDPKVEGELAVTGFERSCKTLDAKNGEMTCSCKATLSSSSVVCSVQWKPEKASAKEEIDFNAINSNPQDVNDVRRIRSVITIKVLAPDPVAAPKCPAPEEEEEAAPVPITPSEDEEVTEGAFIKLINKVGGVA